MNKSEILSSQPNEHQINAVIGILDKYTKTQALNLETASAADILDANLQRREALPSLLRYTVELGGFGSLATEQREGFIYEAANDLSTLLNYEATCVAFLREAAAPQLKNRLDNGLIGQQAHDRLLGVTPQPEEYEESQEFLQAVLFPSGTDETQTLPPIEKMVNILAGQRRDTDVFTAEGVQMYFNRERAAEAFQALSTIHNSASSAADCEKAYQLLGIFYWYQGQAKGMFTDILQVLESAKSNPNFQSYLAVHVENNMTLAFQQMDRKPQRYP